jgi:hypothetical protein
MLGRWGRVEGSYLDLDLLSWIMDGRNYLIT